MFHIRSAALVGLDAVTVDVEGDVSRMLPNFIIVGLPDAAIRESRERVRVAIKRSGFPFPTTKVTVNLAPADIKKEGPAYDLPIAVAILAAQGSLTPPPWKTDHALFLGELAFDGTLKPVAGVLPVAIAAPALGFTELYVPAANAAEAALAPGVTVYPVRALTELVRHLQGVETIAPQPVSAWVPLIPQPECDFAHIKGQPSAKRALEIAAAGGHNVLLSGPPGAGKTMLARAFPGILPAMTFEESLESTKIYSIAGLTDRNHPVVATRPFRAPHHSASGVALIGGGSWPKPGEVSLAHRVVLFLDEFPEFPRLVLENLRQPLEDGTVTISRVHGTLRFPAKFILVAAQNPCPCGNAGDPGAVCSCPPAQVARYGRRVSGPLLDRIDLHVEVPKLKTDEIFTASAAESSSSIRARVERARETQRRRFAKTGILTNAEMSAPVMKRFCARDAACDALLRSSIDRLRLSVRGLTRVLKVARTVADLAGEADIATVHLAEALQFRERHHSVPDTAI